MIGVWIYATDPRQVAFPIKACVGVVFFSIQATVFDDEVESIVHETAIAAHVVLCIAVY